MILHIVCLPFHHTFLHIELEYVPSTVSGYLDDSGLEASDTFTHENLIPTPPTPLSSLSTPSRSIPMILHEKSHVGIAIGANVTEGLLHARVQKIIAVDVFVHLDAHLFDLLVNRTWCVEGS